MPPRRSDSDDGSEFGAGIVVCLAKFSEHLHEHGPFSERAIREFARWTPEERRRCQAEARRYPRGDSAAKLRRMDVADRAGRSREESLSHMIHMWLNAASDHFYDLDDRAPAPLRELAALTLSIGHGFEDELYGIDVVDRIRDLWRASCEAIDRELGVEPDWGHF